MGKPDNPDVFSSRLKALVMASGRSRRELSVAIGRSHQFLAPVLSGKVSPTVADTVKLCRELHTSPNYLTGYEEIGATSSDPSTEVRLMEIASTISQMAREDTIQRPILERVMALHVKGGGRIEAYTSVLPYCDLFEPPASSGRPIVTFAGPESLASITINRRGRDDNAPLLQHIIDSVDDDAFHKKMATAYANAERDGFFNSIEDMDVLTSEGRVKATYSRSLFRVRDKDGRVLILNFSKLIA